MTAPDLCDADRAARVRLASSAGTSSALLCRLAQDDDLMVRAAVAINRHAPAEAAATLARDPDQHVRVLLGERLAALCPDAGVRQQPDLYARLTATLGLLVRDEVARVRLAVAGVLKDMADAPHDLIMHLARDAELPVSEPVLRLSPVLTPEDLLALLAASPQAAVAIAGRTGLDATLCDAVAASADEVAIRTLLENRSADIREATLDRLVQRAAGHADWHAPLVQRPVLSARAAQTLANVVALQLLERLAARTDLPPGLIGELQARLQARLADDAAVPAAWRWPEDDPDEATARRFAEQLQLHGRLNDEALGNSARLAQKRLMAAMLATAAGVPDAVVQKAVMLRSAKALISLVWQGGFSARHVRAVQVLLCQIPPAAALVGPGPAAFPLSAEEMRWQFAFIAKADEAA